MNNQMRFIPISNQYYTILHEKALKLDSLQSRLEKIYGKCDDLLETVVAGLDNLNLEMKKYLRHVYSQMNQ